MSTLLATPGEESILNARFEPASRL